MSEGNGKRGPKAYKIFDHVREKVETLFKESGIEFEGDFLEQMASVYELNQLKTGIGVGYQKQISMLEYHTKAIVDSYIALIQNESADRLQITEDHGEKLSQLSTELSSQQDEITQLNLDLKSSKEYISKKEKELEEKNRLIEAMEKTAAKDEQILAENKERIDRLAKMLSDNTEKVNQAVQIEMRLTELTELTKIQEKKLADARILAEEQRQHFQEELNHNEAVFKERLRNALDRAEIEKDKAVIAIRDELSKQSEQERREANDELRRLYVEVNDLRKQVANLNKVRKVSKGTVGKKGDE